MSYHILHQFDEQWLADLKPNDEGNDGGYFLNPTGAEQLMGRRAKTVTRESQRLAIVVASILMATFALLFALDANRRADTLQHRLDAVEASIKR